MGTIFSILLRSTTIIAAGQTQTKPGETDSNASGISPEPEPTPEPEHAAVDAQPEETKVESDVEAQPEEQPESELDQTSATPAGKNGVSEKAKFFDKFAGVDKQ